MAEEKSFADKATAFMEKPVSAIQFVVDTVMKDGTIAALSRDFVKSLGDTWYATAYGVNDHTREPGSPLTPLYSDIKAAQQEYSGHGSADASPSQEAGVKASDTGTVHGPSDKEKTSPVNDKVDFGQDWNDRVAARREQSAKNQDMKQGPQQERGHRL